jgi:hypothetical protein
MIEFTEQEKQEFQKLFLIYKEKFLAVKQIGDNIKQAEDIVKNLISDIETAKNEEYLLYQSLAEKHDLDITTIQNYVAQTVLHSL